MHWGKFVIIASIGLAFAERNIMAEEDPFIWLEEIEGEKALAWAEAQNQVSLERIKGHSDFEAIYEKALAILTSEERIAYPSLRGGRIYNFWRDARNERGLWRVTSQEEYRGGNPTWEILIDVDQLAAEEERNWVWAGPVTRYPDYDRALIGLSIGGADASVWREFDMEKREFVDDGFALPESKSSLAWRDLDSLFVAPAMTPEQQTRSGYAKDVFIWERGTPVEEARRVFEGNKEDLMVMGVRVWDKEIPYDLIIRRAGFFTTHFYLYEDGETRRIPLPDDAELTGILDGWLLVEVKSDWETNGKTFPTGALLAAPLEAVMDGRTDYEVLFKPSPRQALQGVSLTENSVLVNVLDNVVGSLLRFYRDDHGWQKARLDVPEMGTVAVVSTDDKSDRFFYDYTGFLTPSQLFEADAATDTHEVVRTEPSWFDADGMEVAQFEAESSDGEKIPYFVVKPKGFEADGTAPTLLYGYGGFEVPQTPFYSGVLGASWLREGGVFVLANIRGGGEFGPRWHRAALKEHRQLAFDDFIAVAEDLMAREITSPQHLGIQGGSNGGLLVGAVMVQRPDLFNAVVCQVPLLDMQRYHKLLAGASWMDEYGDPDDPEQWKIIEAYSPYQNVREDVDYPKVFFTTSTRDDRVHPGHARKMVAKMKEQGHDVLYYENIEGGHGGAANLRQHALISALTYAYLRERLAK